MPEESNQQEKQEKQEPVQKTGAPAKKASAPQAAQEQVIAPSQSYWPFALAFSLVVILVGIELHWIVLGLGVVLTAASIIGWGLERR